MKVDRGINFLKDEEARLLQMKNLVPNKKILQSTKVLPKYQSEGSLEAIPENGPATHIIKKINGTIR
jgi:hypothetical protein